MPRRFHPPHLPPVLPPILGEIHALRNEGVFRLVVQAAAVGVGAGTVIACFRALYDELSVLLPSLVLDWALPADGATLAWRIALVFGTLAVVSLLVTLLARWEPLIGGSGIPHVELALAGRLPMPWRRIVPAKFAGTLLSLAGGLSVGREGPSIQMGAAVGCGVGELLHESSRTMPRCLVGGSVAGLTAAFGAPAAGLFFAFEEMKVILSVPLLLFTAVAAASAWLVVDMVFDFGLVFPFADAAPLVWSNLWLTLPLGVGTGLLGTLYNRTQIRAALLYDRQRVLPPALRALPPFLVAGCLFFVFPRVLNGVGWSMADIAAFADNSGGQWAVLAPLLLLLAVKFAFSVFSFASGVPGGLLMPLLGMGGMAGAAAGVAALHFGVVGAEEVASLLPIGMAGLFAGAVRAPLTGIALAAEMTGAYTSLPGMILTALISVATANRLGTPPIYDSLKRRLRHAAGRRGATSRAAGR